MNKKTNTTISKVAGKGVPVAVTFLNECAYYTFKGHVISSQIDCIVLQSLKNNKLKVINRTSIKVIDIINR